MPKKTKFAVRSDKLLNFIGISLLKAVSYLPFWFIYLVSDILAFILMYMVRYRFNVVTDNLRNSFPEKKEAEIASIRRKFYRHFCDVTLESVKGYSMSRKSFDKRFVLKNTDIVDAFYDEGRSILLLLMHFNNWEWCFSCQPRIKHQAYIVYNPIRGNPWFERYLLGIREQWGAKCIPVHKSSRQAIGFNQSEKPVMLALAADQRPPRITRFWTQFLNQETCFYSGPAKIASITNQPVFFGEIKKVRRGHYEATFVPLFMNPGGEKEEDILAAYVKTMEKQIREQPEYYLWSHKRWKQKRPEEYPLI